MLMPNDDKPNRSKFFKGPLFDQMTKDLHLNGKAQPTVYGYLRALRRRTGNGPPQQTPITPFSKSVNRTHS